MKIQFLKLIVCVGFVPLLTNCNKAQYGETAKQAPLPGLAAPKVAAPAAKTVPAVPAKAGSKSKLTDIDGGTPASDSKPEVLVTTTKSNPGTIDVLRINNPPSPIVIGNAPATQPCPQQCSSALVPQIPVVNAPAPVQNVICKSGTCHKSPFVQTYMSLVQNVDVLFVVDSNSNLTDQRFAVFQNIESFLNNLPVNLNYHLAVLNTQDVQTSLYATPSNAEQIVNMDLTSVSGDDRAKIIEAAKQNIWDRISTLNTQSFTGTSDNILKILDRAISSPELEKNQAKGFFRRDAGLVVVSLTDERASNQVLHPSCNDLARKVYDKISEIKTYAIQFHIRQVLPIEFIGFAMLDTVDPVTQAAKPILNSNMLELLYLEDGVLYDLDKAKLNLEQMRADLRFAGDRIGHMWMKRKFQIRPDQALNPETTCFVANGQQIPTIFVPEINELRVDPKASRLFEAAAGKGLNTDILWCENGENRIRLRSNEYAINSQCAEIASKFQK